MPRRFGTEFRGEDVTVVVDSYHYDPSTNALEVEWHFDGVTPEQHDALQIADHEETAIIEEISDLYEQDFDDEDHGRYDQVHDR